MSKLIAIDLFAGAGGLSYGFEQTGCVETKVAVEINKFAQATFKRNHRNAATVLGDIKKLNHQLILDKYGEIDLVIGGPPCQGFSNANRQKSELISGNNQLVKEFVKSIQKLKPRAFVMENVKSMGYSVHKFFVSKQEQDELENLGIDVSVENFSIGQVTEMSNELIQFTKREVDLSNYILRKDLFSKINSMYRAFKSPKGIKNFLEDNRKYFDKLLPNWTSYHHAYWSLAYQRLWVKIGAILGGWYDNQDFSIDGLKEVVTTVLETQRVLRKVSEARANSVEVLGISNKNGNVIMTLKTYRVIQYVIRKLESFGYKVNCGVLNAAEFGVPQVRERLFIVGVREDQLRVDEVSLPSGFLVHENSQFTIGDAIRDLELLPAGTDTDFPPVNREHTYHKNTLQRYLCDSNEVYNHVTTSSSQVVLQRFSVLKPWENFHNLDDKYKASYSDAERTQNTIYLRLDYSKVSKAVCNVRKSMWIHPTINRAISIREAARLQSFPDSFIFIGPKNSQYQQIGNAVPPLLARAVAEQILSLLGEKVTTSIRDLLTEDIDTTIFATM